jgi:hypothetical protein
MRDMHRESQQGQDQEEQLYESARAQANREAAGQWAARAEEATAAGDLARAVRLLSKVRNMPRCNHLHRCVTDMMSAGL